MTTIIQDKPEPPWRGTIMTAWIQNGRRAIDARRYVRRHNRGLPADARVLNFYPMLPIPGAHIRKILERLGLRVGHSPATGGLTIAWDSGTGFRRGTAGRLPPNAINGQCLDISKSLVDRNWGVAAGYSVEIDPLSADGLIVVKSEVNGGHDGRITQGPLDRRRKGFVYQRYVDAVEDGKILEVRTGICGGEIPAVILRWRPANNWRRYATRSTVQLATEAYSATEIEQLLAFARLMHLEYGELDVLRDKASGLIYALDANRTPSGPPRSLPQAEADRHADLMSPGFARLMASHS